LDDNFGHPAGNPIGLGFRVPLMIISPWTRGGYVYSEVCDHTSTIKFLEKRFNFTCNNISPWRRAITGDLTYAFNFTHPDYSFPDLPSTEGNWNKSAS
jgi:phospholipase C